MREDWIECSLSNLFETVTGNTPSKKEMDNYGSEMPFVKPPQINNNFLKPSTEFLSSKGITKARILPINSILVTCIGNLGRIGINKTEVAFNQQINAIKPIDGIATRFTFYQAQSSSFRNQLEKLSTSTTVALVNKTSFNSVRFKIAPLVEQKAIVRKIEVLFSSLDSGIADLKKAQDQLIIYRQAVLKKAFEGEFKKCKLGSLIVKGPTNGMYKPKSFYGSGTPILRIDGFYDGKINAWDTLKKLELEVSELEMYCLQNNDIVINRVNSMPYVGKSAIVKNLDRNCVFESNIMRLRIDENTILPTFLVKYLISPKGFEELQKNVKHAVNQSSINQTDVKNAIIPIPSLKEQHQIVSDIESRLSVCDKVEESIKESLEKAQALRQSILKKAFEGKLLSKDEIAKCKADKDYEPAEVLLERIKNEKKK